MKHGRLHALLFLIGLGLCGPLSAQSTSPHDLFDLEVRDIRTRYLLVGPNGSAVSNEDFRGRFQLISFGYTYCPDICPTTLVEMADILKQLGERAENLQGIFISVDPERDTPQSLQTYTRFFDPRILGLTGSPALVQAAARNFKVRYEKVVKDVGDPKLYAVDHSAGMYLLGPTGGFIKKYGYGTPSSQIAQDVLGFIEAR